MTRSIVARTRGSAHGFIRRMVSPGDLGERMKPFVFLDYVRAQVPKGTGFGFHPHSGIATLTYQLNADVAYEDTAGQKGIVRATGLEWMRAGGGTWHQGFIHPHAEITEGFQLWVALPPGVEDGAPEGIYVAPEEVPQVGSVRVLLGTYEGVTNPIPAPSPIVYLDVVLSPGETWNYAPPEGHATAWAFVYRGSSAIAGEPIAGELVVFNAGTEAIQIASVEGARVLFGSAVPHDHPLVLGSHSVHTNPRSLTRGVENIQRIGRELKAQGRF